MSEVEIQNRKVQELLTGLLGCGVELDDVQLVKPHSSTARGLVTDDDDLVAVIATDLAFAHHTAAALAMIPPGSIDSTAAEPDGELLEVYQEVANVLSRVVNEAMPERVRLDPGMEHSTESLQTIVAEGTIATTVEASVEGYGPGRLGIWLQLN